MVQLLISSDESLMFSPQILLDQGVLSESVEVQENSARAVAYAIETEENMKDLRRIMGIDRLIEMLAALPDTKRIPNDKVGKTVRSLSWILSDVDSDTRIDSALHTSNFQNSTDSIISLQALVLSLLQVMILLLANPL